MESKQKSNQIDMLHGSLLKKILIFAFPVAASSILQQLFNSADVAVVGRFAGSESLAAVGGTASVISLLINLFVGLSVGANVVIATYIGQQKTEKVQGVVHTVMTLAVISGIGMLLFGQVVARPILTLIDTPIDVIDLAVLYLKLYFLGMPFLMIFNFGSAILRSIGDTKRPLYGLLASGFINVGLNLILVIVFHLGVAGVAIATVIADIFSAGLVLYFLIKEKSMIHLDLHKLCLKKEYVIQVVKVGAPAGIQGMVFSLSNVCIQSAVNSFGSAAVAGSAAAANFEFFTYFMTSAFGQAAVTFTSQNFGAKRYDRCRRIFWLCIASGCVCSGAMSMMFVFGRDFFIHIYSTDGTVIPYAMARVMHVEILALMPVLYEVGAAALRGIGYSLLPALLTLIGSCAFRFVWVYTVFPKWRSYTILLNVYPVTWLITSILVLGSYFIIRRKVLKRGESVRTLA